MDQALILFSAVLLTIGVSAVCSLMEAALYAVPISYVRSLAEKGDKSAKILLGFKDDIRSPITAILILNTIANTGGATVAGRAGAEWLDGWRLAVFSISFILAILYVSEIFPKILGVVFCKQIAPFVARPLKLIVKALRPAIALTDGISKKLQSTDKTPSVSEEEFMSMALFGPEEGALDRFEGSVVSNVIGLDRLLVKDIMTPRVVVFRLPQSRTVSELRNEIGDWTFSRVPLYADENPDSLTSYVTQRDVFLAIIDNRIDLTLKEISRPLSSVPELLPADKLLLQMFEQREHLCAVINEHGSLAGIISLEDIIEEIVGQEIVDEYDSVTDLRTFAQIMRVVNARKQRRNRAK